jgi:hypothetical protein
VYGALVEGSRLQPPIDEVLGRRLAVALDEDSEGSESEEEVEAVITQPLLLAFHRLRAAKPQQHTLPQVGTSQAQVPFQRLRIA